MKKILNKIKEFKEDTYGMLIIASWILLIICLIIKLFGGNWFEFATQNDKFISFCSYVDNTIWLKRIIACLVNLFTTLPVIFITLNKRKLNIKEALLFIPLIIIKSIVSWYNTTISMILDFVIMLLLPLIITRKILRPIITIVLVFAFQFMTILLRNMSINFNIGNTTIENILYQVDYYLMIILFYLYNFKIQSKKENV